MKNVTNRLHLFRDEHGTSLVEMAMVVPLFLLLLFGAIDFGRAYYLSMEIAGAAHAAAVYGAQTSSNLTDTAGMQTAAQDDAPNVPNLSVGTPTYGCECADGSHYSANCTATPSCSPNIEVMRVNVTVTGTYRPLFPWNWHWVAAGSIPSTAMTLSSSASMRTQ